MSQIELLDIIRKKPGLYLGKKSLHLLRAYMNGYLLGKAESIGDGESDIFLDFQKYIEDKFSMSQTPYGWVEIISSSCSSDEESFDEFFKLYDDFNKEFMLINK